VGVAQRETGVDAIGKFALTAHKAVGDSYSTLIMWESLITVFQKKLLCYPISRRRSSDERSEPKARPVAIECPP
jgi:hypothetical protein